LPKEGQIYLINFGMFGFIKKISIIALSIFLAFFVVIFLILWTFSSDLPNYKFLLNYEPPVSSRVHAGDGQLIAEFAIQKRLFVPFEAIPKKVINSFLSAEDKNFFKHPGIDAKGVSRAIFNNIKNYLKSNRLEGASTITQQVAKNFLLSNEVTFNRKFKEAILAFRIERALSKERIMELYLNQIYLGQGTYGIAAASLEYFDKPINQLEYEEAALLAALPKAPSRYNPFKFKDLAKKRRNIVLKNLYKNQYISIDQYTELLEKDINLKPRKVRLLEETNYYSEEVRRILNSQYGFNKLYKDGFSIRTPLDPFYQVRAVKALREGLELYDRRHGWRGVLTNKKNDSNWFDAISNLKLEKSLNWKIAKVIKIEEFSIDIETEDKKIGKINFETINWTKKNFREFLNLGDIIYVKKIKENQWELKQLPKVNGAIVVMDPFTGRVLSLVGGFSYYLSEFNRATQAYRQPGSAFKPFVYALALENGYSPSTLVLDAPMVMEQGIDLKLWKPQNYGKKFYGPSTLRTGLEKSRNLMTVRIALDVGTKKITDLTKKLNIYENPEELLSISLGSTETTLLKLTSAYSTFVNGGKKIDPIMIDRIQDRRGKTIYKADKRQCIKCEQISYLSEQIPKIEDKFEQVISPETAYQMISMLEGVIQRGTGRKLKNLNLNLGGKTGTTNNNADTWFIGFTSQIIVGIYVGFDEPSSLGKYETGGKTALPIFKKFILNSISKQDATPFRVPEGIVMMVVDPVTGQKVDFNSKNSIYESFKENKMSEIVNKNNYSEYSFDNSNLGIKEIVRFY
jgi:penicillin-binding protein 1A